MKIVIFNLAEKEYGININQVREVIRLRPITFIPETPDFVEGVISLRGKVIPVVNLRVKLGLGKIELSKTSRIIITRIDSHSVGIVVDNVSDVISIDPVNITPPEEVLKGAGYLIGVAKIAERLVIITDIVKLLHEDLNSQIENLNQRIEIRKKQK